MGICGLAVKPAGSNRTCANLLTRSRSGTPYWSASEIDVARVSIRPDTVEPSLAIFRKISPGWPAGAVGLGLPPQSQVRRRSRRRGRRVRTGILLLAGRERLAPL